MQIEVRMQEIANRKLEIRKALEENQKDLKLDEIKTELESLDQEERGLKEKLEVMKNINENKIEGRKIEMPKQTEQRDFSIMEREELLSTKEYRNAFLKNLQGKELTEVEKRALTTAGASAGAAVPTTTLNMIIDKLRQTSALFSKVNVSYMPGNLSLTIANAKNAASWKVEGDDGVAADDTVVAVTLAGYELIKLVEISAAADAMTMDAFETYISGEIGKQLSIAIENAIVNGDGTGEPTGILSGVTWGAGNSTTWTMGGAIGYDNLMDALALLPTMYHNNAVFVMNRKMVFGGIRKIKDDMKQPIFTYNAQDKAAMTILGYPIILDDYVPDDTVLLCDLNYYYMNFSKSPEIASDRSAGFKSGKIIYRGLLVADGKPALSEAFVRITEALA